MTVVELKAHLYSLIEQEDSVEKLEADEALLMGKKVFLLTGMREN